MKRRNLFTFAGLLGALGLAKAQQGLTGLTVSTIPRTPNRPKGERFCAESDGAGAWQDCGKPKNGQCPVCGTAAQPYPRLPQSYMPAKIIRCARCSNAFWMDAE